jgi:hypothetical protein
MTTYAVQMIRNGQATVIDKINGKPISLEHAKRIATYPGFQTRIIELSETNENHRTKNKKQG